MIQKLTGWITPQRLQGNLNAVPTEVGGALLQAKTAWPSHSEQTIKPDDDYDGLALVVVKPVPRLPACVASMTEGISHVVENVVNIAAVVSVNGVTWTHSLYGGVRLPNIPEDVYGKYLLISTNKDSTNYLLHASDDIIYHQDYNGSPCMNSGTTMTIYSCVPGGEAWELTGTGQAAFRYMYNLIWSNHDMPNGSATATGIYFMATNPVPTN